MPIQSMNPANGGIIKIYDELSDEEVRAKLELGDCTWKEWRRTDLAHRAGLMMKAAEHLRAHKSEYGKVMTLEMGKPITEAEAEVEKSAWVCEYYAENAAAFLKNDVRESDATKSYIRFAPLGVVLAVMPWNFPFWQVFRFAAPGLMAGNVGVLKHASNVPECALMIEKVFRESGFPEGCFQTLLIGSSKVEAVIENDIVKAVTLTGSTTAGSKVAAIAGRNLKKTVLELGGSDPFIVLSDVDVEACAIGAMKGRLLNAGQSCIAAKRFIVLEDVADEFEKAYAEKTQNMIVGDPMDPTTQVGPMSRADLRDELHEQVKKSIEMGAKVLAGGKPVDGPGAFYEPTLLTNVTKGMPVYDEETFGPVAAIIRVKSVEEAIEVANDTPFGLGGSVWGNDLKLAEEVALQIEAGAVFVNGIVKSDPRLPFGGLKKSGYGRELSEHGMHEFVNVQTVWVK
ncbi:MAG: NAD-dependent succinate-semialdehyde dehydrogenase [Candidatus Peregrinibacteria bacterium]|nr:NAD-dependent succinate-semialdehyde dehydrogenase [Candidatus Peregrinibacteria bacterium]